MENIKKNDMFMVFTDGTGIISAFLKKGFQHVFIIIKSKKGWVIAEPFHKEFTIKYSTITDLPRYYNRTKNYPIIKVNIKKNTSKYSRYFFLAITCVSICKYMISYKCRSITPYGLWKHFLKKTPNNCFLGGKYGSLE